MPIRLATATSLLLAAALGLSAAAQSAPPSQPAPSPAAPATDPIALVPLDPASGLTLAGSLTVTGSHAAIGSSGSVTAGASTAQLALPGRGKIRLCATTRVTLTRDPAHAARDHSGLMISLDRGALETDFQTGSDSDVILTPDFRILISGPGQSHVQVRLADHGDTCIDNHGKHPPYVTVSSLFTGAAYRVQPNQRVLFQHGSVTEVVDNESESCGCPAPPTHTLGNNAFPVAQSAGLAPLPTPPPNATVPGVVHAQAEAALTYNGASSATATALSSSANTATSTPSVEATKASPPTRKPGVFHRIGHFFRHLFG